MPFDVHQEDGRRTLRSLTSEQPVRVNPIAHRILTAGVAALLQDDPMLTEACAKRYVRVVLAAFRAESKAVRQEQLDRCFLEATDRPATDPTGDPS